MCDGYEMRTKEMDARLAYFFTMNTNVHLAAKHRIKVGDVMKSLHPKTKAQRRLEEEAFMREWKAEQEQGGDD